MSDDAHNEVDDVTADDAIEPSTPDETTEVESADDEVGLSDALLGRAKEYGLTQDDVRGLDEPRLNRMFANIDRRIMQPQAQQPASQPTAQTSAPAGYTPFALELGEDLDESVSKPLKQLVDHVNAQLTGAHAFRQQTASEFQAMSILREFDDVDRFVTGLGDDWAADYGTGPSMHMDPQSGELRKRVEVHQGAKALLADAKRTGQRMTMAAALKRSHHGVHWDRIAEHAEKKINGKIAGRRRSAGERPTKGKAPAAAPRDGAIAVWNT